ncbi:MAG: VIT1/CCC1 transporter family protein [Candidatus Margulisiibacteriota bacterium]
MKLKHSLKTGLSFGLTSGIITTLGLMVGLSAGTHSKLVVIGGILTIAIADAFSDALGIHVSEESENVHTPREIWEATLATFLSKFFFALTFIVPVLLFELAAAVLISAAWGLSILGILSYKMGAAGEEKPLKVVFEHLLIAVIVIFLTHYAGLCIASIFG